MNKVFYILARDVFIFSWPLFRNIRNAIYSRYLGAVNVNVDAGAKIQPSHLNRESLIKVGAEFHVGACCHIDCSGKVTIGDRVTLSDRVQIFTHIHPIDYVPENWRGAPVIFTELVIGNDAWIGASAIVLPTVSYIGRGAVIAAGSVVSKNVEDFEVVAGVPARVLKKRVINNEG